MANRIYIAIGLIAILFLGAAFAVPWFIDWNAYKERMEQMAAEALGVEVAIAGDMDFTLLPQPRLHFEDVRLGPDDNPAGSAALVEADLSLMDFLRDRFTVTELRLIQPRINLVIDEAGHLTTPIALAETASVSNVSITSALFDEAALAVTDRRSGRTLEVSSFGGQMGMAALRGPFALQGLARFDDLDYIVRLTTSAMNADGAMQLSAFVRPLDGQYSTTLEGRLDTGSAPRFEGQMTYRQSRRADSEEVTGDLVLQSPVVADTGQIALTEFTLLPDEDQAAVRLTGAASLLLGENPAFNASVSGGVVALLPPRVTEEGPQRYELLRLLADMPEPIIPPLPGRLALEVSELGLRGVSLREMELDATTDGEVWTVERFSGRLPGDTTIGLTGTLGRAAGWPAFDGTLSVSARRLDALALLWTRREEGNPLFGMTGTLDGHIRLVNDRLSLADGIFTLNDTSHDVSADIRFGGTPSLEINAAFSDLGTDGSQGLLALLPEIDPAGAFGLSFPQGRLTLAMADARLAGQRLAGLSTVAAWSGEGVVLDPLAVDSFGGVGFEGSVRLAGSLAAPVISGSGALDIAAGAGALDMVLGPAVSSNPLRRVVAGSLPAQLDVVLDPPTREGIQSASFEGRAGAVDVSVGLDMTGGLMGLGREQLGATFDASAETGEEFFAQMGLPPVLVASDGLIAALRVYGNPRGAMSAEMSVEGGGERLDFSGDLNVSDMASIQGQGRTAFIFQDNVALESLTGAGGVWFPAMEGEADLGFVGGDSVHISNIAASLNDRSMSGSVNYAAQRDAALVTGTLAMDAVDLETLTAMLAGPAALLDTGPGVWPDGPIDIGSSPRSTRGRLTVTSPALMAGGQRIIEALAFDYTWGNEDTAVRGLFGEMGGGTVQMDASLCCSSGAAAKSLTGRFTLNGVAMDSVLPAASADVLEGTLTLGAQFQASGDSFDAFAASLNGEGSFSLRDIAVETFSPSAFAAAADVDDLVGIEPDALESIVATALASGPFRAREAGGLASLIGGTARLSNIAIDGDGARLLGGGTLDLRTGALNGQWTLALTRMLAGNGLITGTSGRIEVAMSGTLFDPASSLDIGPMVDAIQMQAYERELGELEALRAAQEARQRAAAEEQARMMEEQSRREAEQLLLQQQQNSGQSEETRQLLDDIERLLNGEGDGDAEPSPEAQPDEAGGEEEDADGAALPTPSVVVLPPGALQLDLL